MSKRRLIILILACAVLAVVLYKGRSEPAQPSYKGRSLRLWIDNYNAQQAYQPRVEERRNAEAHEALESMGTNALPSLLSWIDYEVPGWKSQISQAMESRNMLNRPGFKRIKNWIFADQARAECAATAIWILGERAAGAVPELARKMNDSHYPFTAERAASVLLRMRGTEVMVDRIGGTTNISPTLSALAACLRDTDPSMRKAASNALFQIAPEDLTNALRQTAAQAVTNAPPK